jgi:preprotein translocase subunit SecA
MALDRGTLARIDRRVFTELNHSVGMQVVKVPVSDAVWSTWRRYCDALDVTMGQAVAGLIAHELESSVAIQAGDEGVFEAQKARVLRELESRERELAARARQLSRLEEHLRDWERRLRTTAAMPTGRARRDPKVGRNEQCPCGSGLKYKRCHGDGQPTRPWEQVDQVPLG